MCVHMKPPEVMDWDPIPELLILIPRVWDALKRFVFPWIQKLLHGPHLEAPLL